MKLKGKTAILTGASRGIGTYIAKELANEGVNLILIARNQDGLEKTKSNLAEFDINISLHPADLKNTNGIKDLLAEIQSGHPNINILINNAGIERYRYYQDNKLGDINDILNVNLKAPMELTRLLLPGFLERGGHIVNIASLAGKKGVPHNSIYSTSKAGLIMFTDSLRQELKGTKAGVSVICPGFIAESGMFFDSGLKAPPLLGASHPKKVAKAVVHALKYNICEIVVNKGSIKPLLALNQFVPEFGNKIVELFGVKKITQKRVELES